MIGAFPDAGAAVVAEGAVVCPKTVPALSKTQNIIVRKLPLDSFIRDYDASLGVSVTNKDAFLKTIPLLGYLLVDEFGSGGQIVRVTPGSKASRSHAV